MSDNSIRAFAQLLARARAAIETPGDLDDAARNALIEDVAAFEDSLTAGGLPWPFEIHVGTIDHRRGTNRYVALTREALMAEIAGYCREWWSEIDDERDPTDMQDEAIAASYFEDNPGEFISTDCLRIEPPSIDLQLPSLETGRYCVLSTAHVSTATASLLEKWCSEVGRNRPINVASTIYGWFVPTRDVDDGARSLLPDDLLRAISFGRTGRCEHILFDCDADTVEALPTYDW